MYFLESSRYQTDSQKRWCRSTSNLVPIATRFHVRSPAYADCLPHSIAEEVAAGTGRVTPFGAVELMIRNVELCCAQGILPSFEMTAEYLVHGYIYIYIYSALRVPRICTI